MTTSLQGRPEIERRMIEFEEATRRAHRHFLVGSLLIALIVVIGLLFGVASWHL